MRQLTKLAHNPSDSGVKLLLNAVWEAEKDNGLVNYAPFGEIPCIIGRLLAYLVAILFTSFVCFSLCCFVLMYLF